MSVYKDVYDRAPDDYARNMIDDLQLAAELGKTLLERNKELENCIKQQQNVIDDQAQEIQYLTKQTTALREVNDSRLRIYEQLEVSIQDLERANHRLALENASDKKQIKSLTSTIESLEARCEELQVNVDELKAQLDTYRLKTQRTGVSNNAEKGEKARPTCIRLGGDFGDDLSGSQGPVSPDSSSAVHTEKYTEHLDASSSPNPSRSLSASQNATQTTPSISGNETSAFEDNRRQIDELLIQLDESQKVLSYEKRRVTELEEQLATMVQRNQELEKNLVQLQQKDEEAKSMHDELNTLEEVRQGQLCSRCLRMIDSSRATDNLSFLDDELEDDDSSMMEALLSQSQNRSYTMDLQAKRPELRDILCREMSVLWMYAGPTLLAIFIDLLLYVKERCIMPFLCKPWRYPFILIHCILKHKMHQV